MPNQPVKFTIRFMDKVCNVSRISETIVPTMVYRIQMQRVRLSERSIIQTLPIMQEPVTTFCEYRLLPQMMEVIDKNRREYQDTLTFDSKNNLIQIWNDIPDSMMGEVILQFTQEIVAY